MKQEKAAFYTFTAAIAVWWLCILFFDFRWRAFDAGDPFLYAVNSLSAVEAFHQGGFREWLASVLEDVTGKPGVKALLSLSILAGAPYSVGTYYTVMGLGVLILALAGFYLLWRAKGFTFALIFASFFAFSNLMMEYALGGVHNWPGQALVWLAMVLAVQREGDQWWEHALFGLLLACAVLVSPHLIPFALAVFVGRYAQDWVAFGIDKNWKHSMAPSAMAAAALALWPFLLMAVAAKEGRQSYWEVMMDRAKLSQEAPGQFDLGRSFFPSMLGSGEAKLFLIVFLICTGLGAWQLAKGAKAKNRKDTLLFLPPIIAILYLETSGLPRLGRTFIPLLPFLFIWAACGAEWILKRYKKIPLAALCFALFIVSAPRLKQTWDHFHAGKAISKITGNNPVIVAGILHPFFYMNEEPRYRLNPQRVKPSSQNMYSYVHNTSQRAMNPMNLAAFLKTGQEWVLVSYYASWTWDNFVESWAPGMLHVRDLYNADIPYTEVPGVEGTDYHLFLNAALYYKSKNQEVPFPVKNRLYRSSDLRIFLDGALNQR